MIVAARARWLTMVVHGVDDTGALCGARPDTPRGVTGKWRRSELPINCPRCLMRMGGERWALCGAPTAMPNAPIHIRRVGPEGVSFTGNPGAARALCAATVGWDVQELRPGRPPVELLKPREVLCAACERVYTTPALVETRAAS